MPVEILNGHSLVERGRMFFISHTFASVLNGASVYVRHVTGATEHLHSVVSFESVGQWEFTSFKDTTYTADGTLLTPINRRTDSDVVLGSTFYHTPTIDVLGTPRLQYTFGSGTNPAKSSSSQESDTLESVFEPNADVLVRLTNNSGATQYLSIIYNVYEKELR